MTVPSDTWHKITIADPELRPGQNPSHCGFEWLTLHIEVESNSLMQLYEVDEQNQSIIILARKLQVETKLRVHVTANLSDGRTEEHASFTVTMEAFTGQNTAPYLLAPI